MATATAAPENTILRSSEEPVAASMQLGRLARVGTYVAILVSPAAFFFFRREDHLSFTWSLVCTVLVVLGFRGFLDLVIRRLIPWPSLFGTDDARLQEEDIVNRRRAWTWRFLFRVAIFVIVIVTVAPRRAAADHPELRRPRPASGSRRPLDRVPPGAAR